MVAGKLFTAPMRPGEGVSSSLPVGSERCRGWAESWAKRGAKKTASKKIIPAKRFKIPPEKSGRSCSTDIGKRKAEEFWVVDRDETAIYDNFRVSQISQPDR